MSLLSFCLKRNQSINTIKKFVLYPVYNFHCKYLDTNLKSHISKPQYGRKDTEYAITHLSRNMQDIESQSQCIKFIFITNTIKFDATRLIQVPVEVCRF